MSATSQNVPEALQKWHETSKFLEQNQTSLNTKLKNITQVLDNFSVEVIYLSFVVFPLYLWLQGVADIKLVG